MFNKTFFLSPLLYLLFLISLPLGAGVMEIYCKSLGDKDRVLACLDDALDEVLEDRQKLLKDLQLIQQQTPEVGVWKEIEVPDPVDNQTGIYLVSKAADRQGILALGCKGQTLSVIFEWPQALVRAPEIVIDQKTLLLADWQTEDDKSWLNREHADELLDRLIAASSLNISVLSSAAATIESQFDRPAPALLEKFRYSCKKTKPDEIGLVK